MPSDEEKNKKRLNNFFDEVKKILEYVVTNFREFVPDRHRDFYKLVDTVWKKDICKKFDEIKEELNNAKFKDLKAEGLSGDQLSLKLMQFDYRKNFFDEVKKSFDKVRKRNSEDEVKFWRFKIRDRFKQLGRLLA